MRYTLLLHYPEPADGELDQEEIEAGMRAFQAYAESLADAGALVSAEVLQPSEKTTTLAIRNGEVQIQDGPFADSKEQLAGTFVLDVPDLDAALAWAEKCPAAQWGTVEIRPTAVHFVERTWVPAG
jgi:hypothetical protein